MTFHEVWFRVRERLRKDSLERELRDETEFHREMLARDFEYRGLSPEDAARAAQRKFGNATAVRERSADTWGFPAVENVLQDLRFGARMLVRSPLFAAVSIVAIGLAIGINAGFFTLVDTLLFQPMPVVHPERLVRLLAVDGRGQTNARLSYTDLQTIVRHSRTVQDVVAYTGTPVVLRTDNATARAGAAAAGCVSGNYFSALGGTAVLGRTLSANDEGDAAAPVIVISEALWDRLFARSRDVIGRDVVVNGTHATIVGVISSRFIGVVPVIPDMWMTLTTGSAIGATPGRLLDPANRFFPIRARIRPGITSQRSAAELSGLLAEPNAPAGSQAVLTRVAGVNVVDNSSLIPPSADAMLVVAPGLFLVALVLVIACANLANLLLSRALARQREIAIRLSLGASRRRLLQQLLTESTLIAMAGACLGLALADTTVRLVSRAFFSAVPATVGTVALSLHPSWRVVAYTVALVMLSVVFFGLTPALLAVSPNVTSSLKGEDAAFGTRIRRSRFRDVLVAVQVGACLVLLAAAGTLVSSLNHFASSATGLDSRRVLLAELGIAARDRGSPELASAREIFARRVAASHDVEATARASSAPFTSWPLRRVSRSRSVAFNAITPRYFDVVGQRIVAGRAFSVADSAADARVAIVSQSAARTLWPGQAAVGQTLHLLPLKDGPDTSYQVVGVVADAHAGMMLDSDENGYVFIPATHALLAREDTPLLARATETLSRTARTLDDIAQQLDPNLPLRAVPLTDTFSSELLPFEYGAGVAAAIGVLGLGLAVIGLYGVVSFAVRQRRRELAVHVAMGATPRDVIGLVLRHEMRLVGLGIAAGLVAAAVMAKIIAAVVLAVTPMSPAAFALLTVTLLAVALVATALPAAGALRIAPMQVLRQD
jgi:predicted permease